MLNVYAKILFKVFGLLIKVHLNNEKFQSNSLNPECTKFTSAFIYPIAQNQSKLYFSSNTAEISI